MHASFARTARGAIPLDAVPSAALKRWLEQRPRREAAFLKTAGFSAEPGDLRLVPDASGGIAVAVLGLGKGEDGLALAAFSEQLPAGTYSYRSVPDALGGQTGALAWALGSYAFARYRKIKRATPKLALDRRVDSAEVSRITESIFLARDLINTP